MRGHEDHPAQAPSRRATRPARAVAAVAALALGCAAPAARAEDPAAPVPTTSSSGPAAITQVSDEQTITRWAHPYTRAPIRARPGGRAKRVGRLRLMTEDGFPEVYIALASTRVANGTEWVRIRIPARPNGRSGWVRRDDLGVYVTVRTRLVIDRGRLRATLFRRGKRIFSARIGVGKPATPTPAGRFWIREKFRVSGAPLYGPRAFGTSAYAPTLSDWPGGGVVGLHGTDQPYLIPGRPSHGCVRFRNADIERLYRLMPVGTPIRIL